MEKRNAIALLTDFGNQDSYVAEMKAVILSINPEANIIDITHKIEPQNILHASLMLKRSYTFFPTGTTFVCVIDPGVGSSRKIIFIEASNHNFIAPDNGLLWITASGLSVRKVVTLENHNYFINKTPSTFEGRDKMAPVAAYASLRIEPGQFGPIQSGIEKFEMPEPGKGQDLLTGEIVYFDSFGNAITNISFDDLMENEAVNLPVISYENTEIGPIVSAFSDASNGFPLAYFGSSGFLELAVFNGNFRHEFSARTGNKVAVYYGKK